MATTMQIVRWFGRYVGGIGLTAAPATVLPLAQIGHVADLLGLPDWLGATDVARPTSVQDVGISYESAADAGAVAPFGIATASGRVPR